MDDGFVLEHADRLIFGPCYFVFVLPTICNADVLIASGEADFTLAQSPGSRGHVRWRLRMEEMREKRRVVDSFGDVEQSLFPPFGLFPCFFGWSSMVFGGLSSIESGGKRLLEVCNGEAPAAKPLLALPSASRT